MHWLSKQAKLAEKADFPCVTPIATCIKVSYRRFWRFFWKEDNMPVSEALEEIDDSAYSATLAEPIAAAYTRNDLTL